MLFPSNVKFLYPLKIAENGDISANVKFLYPLKTAENGDISGGTEMYPGKNWLVSS